MSPYISFLYTFCRFVGTPSASGTACGTAPSAAWSGTTAYLSPGGIEYATTGCDAFVKASTDKPIPTVSSGKRTGEFVSLASPVPSCALTPRPQAQVLVPEVTIVCFQPAARCSTFSPAIVATFSGEQTSSLWPSPNWPNLKGENRKPNKEKWATQKWE